MTALVVGSVSTNNVFSGAGLLDDGASLAEAFQTGSWLQGGLSSVGVAVDVASVVTNPLGTLISWGVGWMIDHLDPLKGWMEDLTGDAAEVRGIGQTWQNIGGLVQTTANDIAKHVESGTEGMSGQTIDAYRSLQGELTQHIYNVGGACGGFGQSVALAAELVQFIHDTTRDIIADIVGKFLGAALEAALSVGVLIPKVIANIAATVAKWANFVRTKLNALLDSFASLQRLMGRLKNYMDDGARTLTKLQNKLPSPIKKAMDVHKAVTTKIDDAITDAGRTVGTKVGHGLTGSTPHAPGSSLTFPDGYHPMELGAHNPNGSIETRHLAGGGVAQFELGPDGRVINVKGRFGDADVAYSRSDPDFDRVDANERAMYRRNDPHMTQTIAAHPGEYAAGHTVNVQVSGNARDRIFQPSYDVNEVFGGKHAGAADVLAQLKKESSAPNGSLEQAMKSLTPDQKHAYYDLLHDEVSLNFAPQVKSTNHPDLYNRFEKFYLEGRDYDAWRDIGMTYEQLPGAHAPESIRVRWQYADEDPNADFFENRPSSE